jgi:hypothetical protein
MTLTGQEVRNLLDRDDKHAEQLLKEHFKQEVNRIEDEHAGDEMIEDGK